MSGADPSPFTCIAPSTCTNIEANYIPLGDTSTYTVSSIGYTPPVAYSGGYNNIIVGQDDVWSGVINLPFNFCFYGNNYSQCVVAANGMISFNTALANAASGFTLDANMPSTSASLEGNTICGVGHDINPSKGGQIGWKLVNFATGCRALVVSYYQVPMYYSALNGETPLKYFTGMMVLYENTNIIDVYIEHKVLDINNWNDLNAVVGVQNAAATAAVVAPGRNVLDADWTATNEAWRFTPAGPIITSLVWHLGSGTGGASLGSANPLNVCPTSTTTYTAEVIYALCSGSTMIQTEETTITVQEKKVWDGSVDTDWAKADNWTPSGVPTSMDCVVIPNVTTDPIVAPAGLNGLGLNLTVQNGGILTTNTGTSLTITDYVNVNAGGTYNLKNSSSLIQTNNIANTGNINLERIANLRLQDYSYWSSPVGNGTTGTFPVQSVSPLTPAGYIFKWGTTTANPNGGEGNWINTSENMTPTIGYILRAPNGFTNASASALTTNFIGVPNNGTFTTNIYRGNDYTGLGSQSIPRTATDDNWNLIGNPYPSAIGVNEFLSDPINTNITGGIKIWTHGQLPTNATDPFYQDFVSNYYPSDYITVNLTGATSGSGDYKVGSGQGFMVLMLPGVLGSSTVTFTNNMRSATFANNQFYRNVTINSKNRIWLDLASPSNQTTRTLVGYVENATSEKDRLYDTPTDYKPAQNFYSVLNEEPMEIQGKSLPFEEYDTIDLGFKVATDGIYTIAIAESDGLFGDKKQNIYLEDKFLHTIHDLNKAVYKFATNQGTINDRFLLRYTLSDKPKTATNTDNEVKVFVNNYLTVTSLQIPIKEVVVYDVLGKTLFEKQNVAQKELILQELKPVTNMIIVKTTLETGDVIIKKVLY